MCSVQVISRRNKLEFFSIPRFCLDLFVIFGNRFYSLRPYHDLSNQLIPCCCFFQNQNSAMYPDLDLEIGIYLGLSRMTSQSPREYRRLWQWQDSSVAWDPLDLFRLKMSLKMLLSDGRKEEFDEISKKQRKIG